MASLHCSSMTSLYFMAIYIVRVHSFFQTDFFGGIFLFLLQIFADRSSLIFNLPVICYGNQITRMALRSF